MKERMVRRRKTRRFGRKCGRSGSGGRAVMLRREERECVVMFRRQGQTF